MKGPNRIARPAVAGVLGAFAIAALSACASRGGPRALPPDLPAEPEPCARYCRVWVPPVCRDVPKLCIDCPGHLECVPETVRETRFREICIKPRTEREVCLPGRRCEQTVVQVRPGGYQWRCVDDCWEYCYVPPCYQWCDKVVEEDGIRFCAESPPEYRTVAETVECPRPRTVYVPPTYKVQWCKEVYTPGHWAWRVEPGCDCVCPEPCPTVPFREEPCPPGMPTVYAGTTTVPSGITTGCPPTN